MQKRQNFWQTHSFVNRGKVWQKPSHRNIEPMEEMFLFKCNFAKEGKRMKMLNEPCLLSISNIWTFSFLLLTLSGALFVTMHHNNHDAYFNFPLTSCETNNSTDNYYCLSYMYLNSAKHVSALRPWSHVLAYWVEGPETYEPCTRGTLPRALLYSEHQFLFFWLGSLDFSPFVMSAKFPLLPPKAEAHRIGPGWIQNGDQLEKNSISSQLDWCTALHHIQRVSTFDVGFLVSVHAYQTMHRFVKWKEHKLCRNEKRNIYHPFPSQSWSESKRDVERYDLLRRQWQLKPVKLLNQVRSQSFTGSTGWLPKHRQCFIKGSFPLNRTFLECVNLCISCVECLFGYLFVILFIWCICLIVAFVCFMSLLFDSTTCK